MRITAPLGSVHLSARCRHPDTGSHPRRHSRAGRAGQTARSMVNTWIRPFGPWKPFGAGCGVDVSVLYPRLPVADGAGEDLAGPSRPLYPSRGRAKGTGALGAPYSQGTPVRSPIPIPLDIRAMPRKIQSAGQNPSLSLQFHPPKTRKTHYHRLPIFSIPDLSLLSPSCRLTFPLRVRILVASRRSEPHLDTILQH